MIIEATINSNKTKFLAQKFLELCKMGISADEILVLVQNGRKKKNFVELIKKNSDFGNIGNLNIYSFFGLARHFIEKNWAEVENLIKNQNGKILPNLCGLEVSQYIFKNCIKEIEFKGYNSKINLLHQLLRRYSLIVQNALNEDEIKQKEKILKEAYAKEVSDAINLYKKNTLNLRAFDYLRQVSIFEYLYKNLKNPYKYVILDDGDEITPAVFEYLKHIKSDVIEFFIAYDPYGASRLGYLSAGNIDFKNFLKEDVLLFETKNEKQKNAILLFENVQKNAPTNLNNITIKSFIRRDEMLEGLKNEIEILIKSGTKPSQIAIVSPVIDSYLRHNLNKIKQNVFYLSGSEKLNQNPTVGTIVELLKIINSDKNYYISPFTLKGILLEIFKLKEEETIEITQNYREENFEFKKGILEFFEETNNNTIKDFLELKSKILQKPLSEQLFDICTKYIEQKTENQNSILKLNKLAKQICDFEETFKNEFDKNKLIEQLENTIISENPLSEEEIPENSIIVATAQKLIDNEICPKHLFLLDCSNQQWIKQDIGMLYNSWVFQKNWDKSSFEPEDNLRMTQDRTARILYKLYLCQNEKMHIFSSIYDALGVENFGGIDKYFLNKKENILPPKKITPRADQRGVLEYKSGKMAVSAVAGSGKTTIMLALIIKLLEGEIIKNLKPQNIFVLTFMESAARNFKERIKQNFPDMIELPQISTIHGLALRILKENNNYAFLGLDNDFEIIDDLKRREIITLATIEAGLETNKVELYEKAISDFKNDGAPLSQLKKSPTFKYIFEKYQKELLENNFVDYDDLLMYALRILKTNSSVRKYYQELAQIVIEDEAQDSSPTQQELITILGAKHGNIIRCGDVNQAITSTFSNSDVKGFKKFINTNLNVEMNFSQRCATEILDFANNTIDFAKKHAPEAFLDIKMQPVEGKNSKRKNAVKLNIYQNSDEEKQSIINKIKQIRQDEPNSDIAILLRSNWAITNWADYIETYNIKVEKNFDILNNNPVFRTVLAIFNFIFNPYDKKILTKSLEELLKLEKYKDEFEILQFIKENDFFNNQGSKFQIWWDLKYFLLKNSITPMELVLEIGDFYFENNSQRANVAMVYSIIENIFQTHKNFENTVLRLREISNRINKSTKFFEDKEKVNKSGVVKIMTLHKSKGDEFDHVFIPELTSTNLGLEISEIKLKENSKFLQQIKKQPKSDEEIKKEILDENFRLLYVGITRAKEVLYLSCANSYKFYGKTETKTPCKIFEIKGGQNEHI